MVSMKTLYIWLLIGQQLLSPSSANPAGFLRPGDKCGYYNIPETINTALGLNPFLTRIYADDTTCLGTFIHPRVILSTSECDAGFSANYTVRLLASPTKIIKANLISYGDSTLPDTKIFLLNESVRFNLDPRFELINQLCLPSDDRAPGWQRALYTFQARSKVSMRLSICQDANLICAEESIPLDQADLEEGAPLMVVDRFRLTVIGFHTKVCAGGKPCNSGKPHHFIPLTQKKVKDIQKFLNTIL